MTIDELCAEFAEESRRFHYWRKDRQRRFMAAHVATMHLNSVTMSEAKWKAEAQGRFTASEQKVGFIWETILLAALSALVQFLISWLMTKWRENHDTAAWDKVKLEAEWVLTA